jgi:hypothetical protein
MSDYSKKNICFVMFVDQESLDVILQEEEPKPSAKGDLGLWRIVLIKNLPYLDGRRNGKVPKFLTHRIFPNARFVHKPEPKAWYRFKQTGCNSSFLDVVPLYPSGMQHLVVDKPRQC